MKDIKKVLTYGKTADMNRVSDAEEIAGHGIRVLIDGKEILIGNGKLKKHIDFLAELLKCLQVPLSFLMEDAEEAIKP